MFKHEPNVPSDYLLYLLQKVFFDPFDLAKYLYHLLHVS